MIDREQLRSFFEEKMREKLFSSCIVSRDELCAMWKYYTGKAYLTLDEKIELIASVLEYLNPSVEIENADEAKNENIYFGVMDSLLVFEDERYHALEFAIDPVVENEWADAMNNIYSSGAQEQESEQVEQESGQETQEGD